MTYTIFGNWNRFLFLLIFVPALSEAQVVNVERQRLNADSNGWYGDVDISYSIIKMNEPLHSLSAASQVVWRKDKHQVFFIENLNFIRSPSESYANNGFLHVRYQNPADKRLMSESFVQVQYNKLLKVMYRQLIGGGGRLQVFSSEQDKDRAFIGAVLMNEYEIIQNREEVNFDLRWSFYAAFSIKPWKNLEVNSTTYYQPILGNGSDYRISTENAVLIDISEKLQFKLNYILYFDSKPPPDVVKETYTLTNGVRYKF